MRDNASSAGNQQERLSVLPPEYIVGLVDGEGYFSITTRIDSSKPYRSFRVQMVFGIKLKEGDGGILYDLQRTFGCGIIRKRVDDRPTFSDCLEYQVRDFEAIKKVIIPFFKQYSLRIGSKQRSFEKFVEIADLFEKGLHLQARGFQRVKMLAKRLHR